MQIRLPFFETSPEKDIRYSILFIPFFWILGVSQVVWPFLATIFWVKSFLTGAKSSYHPILKVSFFFLLTLLLSGLFIVEPPRYATFFRDLSIFLSATVLFWYTISHIQGKQKIHAIVSAVAIFGVISSVTGLLAYYRIITVSMDSPFSYLLPGALKSFKYVGNLAYLGLVGDDEGDFYGTKLTRIKSFFYDATSAGGTYCIILPLQYYWSSVILKGPQKLMGMFFLLLSIVALYFMNTRTGVLALMVGMFIVYLWSLGDAKPLHRYFVWGVLGVVGTVILLNLERIIDLIDTAWMFVVNMRYPTDRLFISKMTFSGWLDRFFFGWGTQRDYSPNYPFPLGSHGAVLGMLYKHGIIGFLLFGALFFYAFLELIQVHRITIPGSQMRRLSNCLAVALISTVICSFTIDIELDAIRTIITWLMFALVVCLRGCCLSEKMTN